MWRKLSSLLLILHLGVAVAATPARVNQVATRYTLRLPAVDKIELEKVKGEMLVESIEATKVLEGREAKAVAALWRRQDYSRMAANCHYPVFGIKFYSKGKLIARASLCWECNSIVFLTPDLNSRQGFDGDGKRGMELLAVFTRAFEK